MLKRLLFGALISACVTAAALAGSMTLLGVGKPAAGGGGGFSLTAQGSAGSATTGTTTINYGTVSYGSGCNAVIAVVFWYNTGTADTISSLTIGGNSTTAIAGTAANDGTGGGQSIAMRQWSSPSGTSGAVSVTYSANVTYNSNVTLYCLISGNTTVSATNAPAGGACNNVAPITGSITVPASGTAITAASTQGGQVISWTNATADGTYTGGGTQDAWGHTTATGSVNVSATPAGSDNCAMSLAAWGP